MLSLLGLKALTVHWMWQCIALNIQNIAWRVNILFISRVTSFMKWFVKNDMCRACRTNVSPEPSCNFGLGLLFIVWARHLSSSDVLDKTVFPILWRQILFKHENSSVQKARSVKKCFSKFGVEELL